MAFGKKKTQQPEAVKIDKASNPFYPPRKESIMKEIGTTLGVVVVCILLVGVVVKNFNYMAVAGRQESKNEVAQAPEMEMNQDVSIDEKQEEIIEEQPEDYLPVYPGIDQPGKVIEDVVTVPTPEVSNGDYIIPDSNTRYITDADLEGLTQEELRIARNELYARHGRMFKDQSLQDYFNSKDWYTGTISPDNFTQEMLNDIERANAATISDFEARKGY